MAEQFKSITDARKMLPELSQTAQEGMDLYVITNKGKPQSVLIGHKEYLGMKAALELLSRPPAMSSLQRGLAQKKRLTFEEVKENLRQRAEQDEARGAGRDAIAGWVKEAPAGEALASPLDFSGGAKSVGAKLDEINARVQYIIGQLSAPESGKLSVSGRRLRRATTYSPASWETTGFPQSGAASEKANVAKG